jgi:hypothetical protein
MRQRARRLSPKYWLLLIFGSIAGRRQFDTQLTQTDKTKEDTCLL